MSYFEQPEPIECPACDGGTVNDWQPDDLEVCPMGGGWIERQCQVCNGDGYVTASERRNYIADGRADSQED